MFNSIFHFGPREPRALLAVSVMVGMCGITVMSFAQDRRYPDKPIRFVNPFPPGGATDVVSRLIGQKLGERLGQQVVVENRAGGAGIIAAELVAKAPADGYTLLLGNTGILTINPLLYKKLPYDPIKDFAPVSLTTRVPNVFVVHPSLPVRTIKELVTFAKQSKKAFNYATPGSGSLSHLAMEMFKIEAGVKFVHIPYKGGGPATIDLLAGQVELMIASMASVLSFIEAEKLRALAVCDVRRSALMPKLPTVSESGYPNYEATSWHGVLVAAGTPSSIVAKLNKEITAILATQDVKETLFKSGGFEVVGSTAEEFSATIKSELSRYAPVVKASNARID